MGLAYTVGITSAVVVWPPHVEPLPPQPYSNMGRPPVMPRCTADIQPVSVKALAEPLPSRAFQNINWREGANATLSGRFAAVRVRHAGGNSGRRACALSQYVLSTLPEDTPINELVSVAHQRWRIERDYQDLKQDFGLGHYEGRGWRGVSGNSTVFLPVGPQ